eukprot:2384686-Amphidinium_carterae.1
MSFGVLTKLHCTRCRCLGSRLPPSLRSGPSPCEGAYSSAVCAEQLVLIQQWRSSEPSMDGGRYLKCWGQTPPYEHCWLCRRQYHQP